MKTFKILLISALAVAVVAAAALASCAKKKPLPQQTGVAKQAEAQTWDGNHYVPEAGASLKLWWDVEEMAEVIVEKWGELYPEIPLEYEHLSVVDTRQKMILDGPAGLGADVFVMPHDGILAAHQDGILLPLGRYGETIKRDFQEQAVKVAMIDGQQYAIPWTLENIALFYNKDLYGESPPLTWDEIIEFAQSYNDPATNKWAIRWDIQNSYINYFFLTAYGFRLFGPNASDAQNPGWDSPEVIEGLKFFSGLRAKIFDVNSADATGQFSEGEFAKGIVPLTITGPWKISEYKEAGLNFGVAALPLLPEGRRPYPYSGVQMINVSSYSQYPNAARRLAMFMASDEIMALLYKATGKLPASNNANSIEGLAEDPYQQGILAQAPYSHPIPSIPEVAFTWGPQSDLFSFTWNGELSPEEAVKKATEAYKLQLETSKQ